MKPHKPTARSKSAGLAAARTLMREKLGWLRGFPTGGGQAGAVAWMCVPAAGDAREAEQVEIGPTQLRRATKGADELFRRFPRALPALVGDRALWHARVLQVLAALKSPIHGRRSSGGRVPFPGELAPRVAARAAQLRREHPSLEPLLDALAWLHFTTSDQGLPVVRALERDPVPWAELLRNRPGSAGVAVALRTLDLCLAEGAERSHHILALLADRRSWETSLGARRQDVKFGAPARKLVHRLFGGETPFPRWAPDPAAILGPEVARLVPLLLALDRAPRRQVLSVLELVLPLAIVERWETWWRRHAGYVEAVDRALRCRGEDAELRSALRRLRGQALRLEGRMPPAIDANELRQLLGQTLPSIDSGFRRQMLGILPHLPAMHQGSAPRLRLLQHWTSLRQRPTCRHRLLTAWLTCFQRYIADQQAPVTALAPWQELVATSLRHVTVPEEILAGEKSISTTTISVLFGLLHRLVERFPRDLASRLEDVWEPCEIMARIVEAIGDPATATDIVTSLMEAKLLVAASHLHQDTLAGLLTQSSEDSEKLALLIRAMTKLDLQESLEGALRRGLAEPDVGEFLAALLLDRRFAPLKSLLSAYQALLQLGEKPPGLLDGGGGPSSRPPPAWPRRYPAEYRDLLAALDTADPRAQPAAARILGPHFPDRDALRRQIARIGSELERARGTRGEELQARQDGLRRRCDTPDSVSSQRRANLRARLERRLRDTRLRTWESELRGRLRQALTGRLDSGVCQEWIGDPHRSTLLAHLLSLEARFRSLAIRLLEARAGPRPWDLRDAAPNRAFLDRMREMGIVMEPWLDGIGTRSHPISGDAAIHLRLEDDPFEIFLMGAHFKTCLSPGAFNFFSVVANAVDINKRVLYARDDRGEVQGRCLLALTRPGRIVLFDRYAHDAGSSFSSHAETFADALARAMNTTVDLLGAGEVETLLAPEWYDDGAEDLAGTVAALAEGSRFRLSIVEAPVDGFLEAAAAALAPRPLNEATLPLLLRLPEIESRPDLAALLLGLVTQWDTLPDEVLFRAARITRDRHPATPPPPVMRRRLGAALKHHYLEVWWSRDQEFLVLLFAHLSPGDILRLLRQTRGKSVHRWSDENSYPRLVLAAMAHEALNRPRIALDLYRQAASGEGRAWPKPKEPIGEHIDQRIQVLAALLASA